MIIFVGDKPGNKNLDPRVAFVGTQSYRKLLEWIFKMNISINDIALCNKDDIKTYSWGGAYVQTKCIDANHYYVDIMEGDKVVALGRKAEKRLKELGVKCFYLPHPSGANPKANAGKELDQKIKECARWING